MDTSGLTEHQLETHMSGWTVTLEGRKIISTRRKTGFVEEDGKTSIQEDFANNIEYFLYNPDKLKSLTPSIYNWIKTKYGEKFKIKRNSN